MRNTDPRSPAQDEPSATDEFLLGANGSSAHKPRAVRSFFAAAVLLVFALGVVPAGARAQPDSTGAMQRAQRARQAYGSLQLRRARTFIESAIAHCERACSNEEVARMLVLAAAIEHAIDPDSGQASERFRRAIAADHAVRIDEDLTTPELRALLAEARADSLAAASGRDRLASRERSSAPESGVWHRLFFEAGYSFATATVGRNMEADSLPDGLVPGTDPQADDDVSNNSLYLGGSNRCDLDPGEYCVRVNEGLLAFAHSVHFGVGVYITDRVGVSLRVRYAPAAGQGTLSNLAFGLRGHYRFIVPRLEGLQLGTFVGVSVGQYQVRPTQEIPPGADRIYRPYAQTGLVGVELGANIGYRFHPHVGVFVQPSWYLQVPSVSSGLQLTVGVEFSLARVDDHAPYEYDEDEPPLEDDSERDGIRGDRDLCPSEVEDIDGHEDADGCPDPDNDGDGVPDARDTCPSDAEDMDGFEDRDGCPESDNDEDGLVDGDDQCPSVPGPVISHGCPEDDGDQDGVPDRLDNCPAEAGPVEYYGCLEEQQVQIREGQLVLSQQVYFRRNSHLIHPGSVELLAQIAAVMNAHTEIRVVRVEVHTDSRGNARRNQALSERRAASVVRHLTRIGGVDASRLTSQGLGDTQLIQPDAQSDAEHAVNRRVEFRILE